MAAGGMNPGNGSLGDPCFAGTRGGGHQAVGLLDGSQGIDLERVRSEFPAGWYSDACKYVFQPGIRPGFQRRTAPLFANGAFRPWVILFVTGH